MKVLEDSRHSRFEFEAGCLKRQGIKLLPAEPKVIPIFSVEFHAVPIDTLRAMSNDELTLIRKQSSGKQIAPNEELDKARFGKIFDGSGTFAGGCAEFAEKKAALEIPFYVLATRVQDNLNKVATEERKVLAPIRAKWIDCLNSEARKFVTVHNLGSPPEARLAMGQMTLQLLLKSADLQKFRDSASAERADQALVVSEVDRCEEKTGFLRAMDDARSLSLQKALKTEDLSAFMQSLQR
jgi:hypothetical protein